MNFVQQRSFYVFEECLSPSQTLHKLSYKNMTGTAGSIELLVPPLYAVLKFYLEVRLHIEFVTNLILIPNSNVY